MYEHEEGSRTRRASAARTLGAPADEGDARAQARRALQDSYDWRDDEQSRSWASPDARSAAARAEARRSRQEVVRSVSRTVGV